MSTFQAYRRTAVAPQAAQKQETLSFPAPTRGIIMDENWAYMQPGGAVVLDNWKPTLRGIQLRGGCDRYCVLPETVPIVSAFNYVHASDQKMFAGTATNLYDVTDPTPQLIQSGQHSGNYAAAQLANMGGDWLIAVNDYGDYPLRFNGTSWTQLAGTPPPLWSNNKAYAVNDLARDPEDNSYWKCLVAHTSAVSTLPPAWANGVAYAVNAPVQDASDGTYWLCIVAHTSNASGTFAAERYNTPYWLYDPQLGTTSFADERSVHPTYWGPDQAPDGSSWITAAPGTNVFDGKNLTHVCKYRNRLFFIEASSMNAWYLPVNSVGGVLNVIPLSGAATKGGTLLFCTVWSVTAGDGLSDKIVFGTTEGELLIFEGSDPSNINSWKQDGRYQAAKPMGMNGHMNIGGDLLLITEDGIVPISACIAKSFEDLELAAITHQIRMMWRDEVAAKRSMPWTMINWEMYGGVFVTLPGGTGNDRLCLINNTSTTAWARYTGWDATCFVRLFDNMYFGTQSGVLMQADVGGYDDGQPYTATMVGGWEVFQSPGQTITWRQSRCSFSATAGQPFKPQLSACTDYVISLPPPPPAGPDPGLLDVWDQALWGPANPAVPPTPSDWLQYGQWDQPGPAGPVVRNTMWVSVGKTGFSHAPVVQVTVAQLAPPNVELITTNAVFDRAGIDV